jgi:hypothetical protein
MIIFILQAQVQAPRPLPSQEKQGLTGALNALPLLTLTLDILRFSVDRVSLP